MSPERNWRMRVDDILTCIRKIKSYTSNMTFEQFDADDKTKDAVIRNFEIIGEAASHIPLEIQDKYPHLDWLDLRDAEHHRPRLFWNQHVDYLAYS